ncbi:MAG: sodium:proton antiporter [Cyanobium sp. NAT70]|nr:sodium:proton antiporter [Cyanobium sp. NAT70]|tara:strand:+ start:1215 stop:2498 length:1284 start_codon:yes stop_codon:yes gene_type:complete
MNNLLDIPAILLFLAALFGSLNYWFINLPRTIGLMVIALVTSLGLVGLDFIYPALGLSASVNDFLAGFDFNVTLTQGMLSFLLFAGALHVDLGQLLSRKWTILILASFGVLISSIIIGGGFWLTAIALGLSLPLLPCMVLGVIVSPTDPVAVLGLLKTLKVPDHLKAEIAGESLFNDGVALVLFSILVSLAFSSGDSGHAGSSFSLNSVFLLFIKEAFGGALLGLAGGFAAFWAMRQIDDYVLEVLITLALVTGAYSIALHLDLSGPIAMVIAGLLIGNQGTALAMSETTRDHVEKFWDLIDEILNSLLFLLIGLEIVLIVNNAGGGPPLWITFILVLSTIVLSAGSRFLAIFFPLQLKTLLGSEIVRGTVPILTWAGIRGGVSVALALSLPDSPERGLLLLVTYCVVLFSVIVQGLTVEGVIKNYF